MNVTRFLNALIRNNYLRSVLFLIIALVVTVSSNPVLAVQLSEEQRKLFRQQVLYFDYDSSQLCTGGSTIGGSNNEEKVWNFLSDPAKNLKDFQVAGIMGNMVHESGLNPNAAQPSTEKTAEEYVALGWDNMAGHAYGIVQWDRGSKLTDNVKPLSDANKIEVQLEFLWNQLLGNEPVAESKVILEDIRATTNTKDAVLAFQGNLSAGGSYYGFERPADQSGSVPERLAAAEQILKRNQGSTPSATAPGSPTSCLNSTSQAGGFVETVKAYAWPDYHKKPYLDMMPAYEDAVRLSIKEGRYVGGQQYKGIDCGGFVTTLMVNSGFEPNYNYGGVIAAGAGPVSQHQEPWLKANWQQIHPASTADMQPGDVAVSDAHTYVYVGKIEGFNSLTASASHDERAPMAGAEKPADKDYRWYRKN